MMVIHHMTEYKYKEKYFILFFYQRGFIKETIMTKKEEEGKKSIFVVLMARVLR